MDLPELVRAGIDDAGFTECTPIQASTLPLALEGSDVAGQAQTGTGKTAAFLIATFARILKAGDVEQRRGPSPRALVIAPTRELVVQIRDEAILLGKHCGLELHAVYGGVDYVKQLDRLKQGVDILVGTPGRLIDYYRQRAYRLDKTEVLVIDEADRMFDMGFIDDIRFLIRKMPSPDVRQSFLYSATLSQRVLELAYEHMNRVERIAVSEDRVTADNISQIVYHVGKDEKLPVLLGILEREQPSRTLIFVNMRHTASDLALRLQAQGYSAGALAGDLDQRKRIKLLNGFKEGEVKILVATDVASRGLHIESVSHVFNYDLPQDPEDYVHRIGRTARAGASGKAVSLACERYVFSLEAIEEYVGAKIPHDFPDDDLYVKPVPFTSAARGRDSRKSTGSGSRRGRSAGPGPRKQQPRKAQGADAAAKPAAAAEGEASKKRPRRRSRRRRGASSDNSTGVSGSD